MLHAPGDVVSLAAALLGSALAALRPRPRVPAWHLAVVAGAHGRPVADSAARVAHSLARVN